MAGYEPTYELGSSTAADYRDHEHMYRAFLRAAKYCVGAIIVILILMAFFLT